MTALLAIVCALLIIAVIIVLICFIMNYFCDYQGIADQYGPKLEFNAFKKFYEINPERWEICFDSHVECKITRKTETGWTYTDRESFHFSYIDTQRYLLWKHQLKKHKEDIANDKATARMLAAVKQDVADFEAKTMRETREALETIRSLTK